MITRAKVNQLERLAGQLEGIHEEISALAKKMPNNAVNHFKLKFVNAVLSQCNELLGPDYKPLGDFNDFNLDDVPSNSDVTFMVTQYLLALEKMRSDNVTFSEEMDEWIYNLPRKEGTMTAAPPRKLQK